MYGDHPESLNHKVEIFNLRLKYMMDQQSYKDLSPQQKVAVRLVMYKKIAPAFAEAGQEPPSLRDFLNLTAPESYWQNVATAAGLKAFQQIPHIELGAAKVAFSAITYLYREQMVAQAAAKKWGHWSAPELQGVDPNTPEGKAKFDAYNKTQAAEFDALKQRARERADKSIVGKILTGTSDHVNDIDFFARTHPLDSKMARVADWAGETAGQFLPWVLAEKAKIGELAMDTSPRFMAENIVGRQFVKMTADYFEGYVGNSLISGGTTSKKQNEQAGAAVVLGGRLLEGAATALAARDAIKDAIMTTTKDWLHYISTGEKIVREGKEIKPQPIVEDAFSRRDTTQRADVFNKGNVVEGEPFKYKEYKEATSNVGSDAAAREWSAHVYGLGGDGLVDSMITSAYTDLITPKQLTATTDALTGALTLPPGIEELHIGEQKVIQDIALKKFGVPIQALPEPFQKLVLMYRYQLAHESLPQIDVHNPEMLRSEITKAIDEWAKMSPAGKANLERLKKQGIDLVDVLTKDRIESIKKDTGIKSSKAANNQARNVTKKTRPKTKQTIPVDTKVEAPTEGETKEIEKDDVEERREKLKENESLGITTDYFGDQAADQLIGPDNDLEAAREAFIHALEEREAKEALHLKEPKPGEKITEAQVLSRREIKPGEKESVKTEEKKPEFIKAETVKGTKREVPKDERDAKFNELAKIHAGAPTSALKELQSQPLASGLYTTTAAEVSDISRLLTQPLDDKNFAQVSSAVDRAIRRVENPNLAKGSREQQSINYKAHLKANPGAKLPELISGFNKAKVKFASAHAKMPAYNKAQELARDAAVDVGNSNFKAAAEKLKMLKATLDEGKEAYKSMAGAYSEGVHSTAPGVGKATFVPKSSKEYEPKEGASASFSMKDFISLRKDSVSYLKNPSNGRLAKDGTRIGARDTRTWNERMKSDNFNDFIDDLKVADGNDIIFEDPRHRLLFHYANRAELPTDVNNKLRRMLKFKFPNDDAQSLGKRADRLLIHLYQLARVGRITKDKNVFKSSEFAGAPTKWQFGLNTEVDKQEIDMLRKIYSQHPGTLKAMEPLIQIFQANRLMQLESDPEQWLQFDKAIRERLAGGF